MASFFLFDTQTAAQAVVDSAGVIADTARASGVHEEGENLFAHLLKHVQDAHELETPFGRLTLPHLSLFGLDMSITKHVVFLWVAAIILIIALALVARKNKKQLVPTGFGNLIEIFVVFVRDEIAIPNMGIGGIRYLPYLLTTFFFILLMNLLGLVPIRRFVHRKRQRYGGSCNHRLYHDSSVCNPHAGARPLLCAFYRRRPLDFMAYHGSDRDSRDVHQSICIVRSFVREHDRRTHRHRIAARIDLCLRKIISGAGIRSLGTVSPVHHWE